MTITNVLLYKEAIVYTKPLHFGAKVECLGGGGGLFLSLNKILHRDHDICFVADDNFPRLPDVVDSISTESTVTITWSFTSVLETRNETFTVLYGTSPGQLELTSDSVQSVFNMTQYSIQLMSLQPGTTYYYLIQSANNFTTLTDSLVEIRTMDSSKLFIITLL